jgi:glycogen debranching enzyme
MNMDKQIKEAYKIAVKAVKDCSTENGYYAALNHYKNIWARDAFFASLGGIYFNRKIVKNQLLLFIKYQKKNGHIPRLVPRNFILRNIFMPLERFFNTPYVSPILSYFSRDQNSLFVISAYEYIKKTKDYKFAKEYFDNFERAIKWNFKKDVDKDLIVEQGVLEDWEDSAKKDPESLFLNVCNYRAIECLSEIAFLIKNDVKKKQYKYLGGIIKEQINKQFWAGSFYAASLKPFAKIRKRPIFSSSSNVLAIYWGIADKQKAKKIFDFIEKNNLESFSIRTSYPSYKRIWLVARLMGVPDYHTKLLWLWIGCMGVLAYQKYGYKKKAKELLKKVAEKINEYNEVYEVYEPNGEPVNRIVYKSAYPFSWSAGLFVYAVNRQDL